MKVKTFDCVEMKREGSLRIHEETKNLTFDQKVEYWRQRSEEFMRRQAERRRIRPPSL
jgi:hypothetical protein